MRSRRSVLTCIFFLILLVWDSSQGFRVSPSVVCMDSVQYFMLALFNFIVAVASEEAVSLSKRGRVCLAILRFCFILSQQIFKLIVTQTMKEPRNNPRFLKNRLALIQD